MGRGFNGLDDLAIPSDLGYAKLMRKIHALLRAARALDVTGLYEHVKLVRNGEHRLHSNLGRGKNR
jgi:hypothetical protein